MRWWIVGACIGVVLTVLGACFVSMVNGVREAAERLNSA